MKIFNQKIIKKWEQETCKKRQFEMYDLVQRAGKSFCAGIIQNFPYSQKVLVLVGPGNNGADGMLVAKELFHAGKKVTVLLVGIEYKKSLEWEKAHDEIKGLREKDLEIIELNSVQDLPDLKLFDLIIDAILGAGLNKPLEGIFKDIVMKINLQKGKVPIVSLDIPTGLYCDSPNKKHDEILFADLALSVEQPKLSFFFFENFKFVPDFQVARIGLDSEFCKQTNTQTKYFGMEDIKNILMSKPRQKGDHKGLYGKAMLIGGKTRLCKASDITTDKLDDDALVYNNDDIDKHKHIEMNTPIDKGTDSNLSMIGAIVLAAQAAARTGVGKLFVHVPGSARDILHTCMQEVIVSLDKDPETVTSLPNALEYDSIGVGTGLGVNVKTNIFLHKLIHEYVYPIVFDADAINILAVEKLKSDTGENDLLNYIPPNSIITPHVKEFESLINKFGLTEWERIEYAKKLSQKHKLFIVMKGAYTKIITPSNNMYINSTGNRGMAKSGMGDVLTGLITGFLAQGYSSLEACLLGVFIHGLAGDIATGEFGQISVNSADLIENISRAILQILEYNVPK